MEALNILIIEDEMLGALNCRHILEDAGHRVTGIVRNLPEAKSSLARSLPDFALVDIRLGNEDGIEVISELLKIHTMPFLYLTAHSERQTLERALQTYPAGYLLKPFEKRDLLVQLEVCWMNHNVQSRPGKGENDTSFVFLPVNKGYDRVEKNDILFAEADGSYVRLYTAGEVSPRLLTMNLGYLSGFLTDDNFYRISRSLLINLDHLKRMEKSAIYLNSYSGPISIPESGRKELMRRLTVVRTQ